MDIAIILIDSSNVPSNVDLTTMLNSTVEKVKQFSNDIYFLSKDKVDGLNSISFETSAEFLDFLSNTLSDKTVMLLNAYSPLLDIEATKSMIAEHKELAFDYTYPENLPKGLVPELFNSDIANFIKNTIPKELPMFEQSIKEIFESDISSYDSNIFIHPSEIVKYRVDFIPNSYNNYLLIENIITNHGTDFTIDGIDKLIETNPALIRKRPTYYEIELTTEREGGEMGVLVGEMMDRDGNIAPIDFETILQQIADFSYNPVVMLGLYGEPFLHPQINDIIDTIAKYPNIRFIFESRSILTNFAPVQKALDLANVEVIFDVSAANNTTFEKLKKPLNTMLPFENLDTVSQKINSLSEKHKQKIYLQFSRCTFNEDEIMRFYENWQDFKERIIIRKIDTFGGKLNNYRVVDLSPIKRHFCLHLKHDMVIHYSGDIAMCRQDYEGTNSVGNILNDGIETCWAKLGEVYSVQSQRNFDKPTLCSECDEWWIFNF